MQIESLAYDKLPFTPLFKSYIRQFEQLTDYYHYPPFAADSFKQRAHYLEDNHAMDRSELVRWLTTFNESHGASRETLNNIDRLSREESVAIVTGQQVNVLGGPLFTVYKTLTTIHLADYWEEKLGRPVLPVFWMGDEDHDYEEIKRVILPKSDDVFELEYERPISREEAVSHIELDERYTELRAYLEQELIDTDFSENLWSFVDESYQEGRTFGEAFGRLLLQIFGNHGLVLAGSHDRDIKQVMSEPLQRSVRKSDEIRKALEDQSQPLAEQFHQQVTIFDSNLFLHSEEDGRVKIHKDEQAWYTDGGHRWSQDELLQKIDEKPEQFSPNVFLRPILQDHLLPTLGYVGGPGEIAYYGQMKKMYEEFELQMPIVVPRLSATVMESNIDRIYKKLPFEISDYQQRIEDLESAFAREAEDVDVDQLFEDWKKQVQELSDEKSEEIEEIDPTLVKAVGKATAVYFNELDKLRGKVHRSTKKQEEIQLNRIRKIKHQLFPNDELQERVISFIYYMNKYGVDVWDRVLDQLSYDENYREHQIIHL